MITVISLSCPNCGSALKVAPESEFVPCAYCSAQLQLKRDDRGLLQQVAMLSTEVEILRLEAEIRKLDERWRVLRQSFQVQGEHESRDPYETSGQIAIALAVIVPICGLCLFGFTSPGAWIVGLLIGTI